MDTKLSKKYKSRSAPRVKRSEKTGGLPGFSRKLNPKRGGGYPSDATFQFITFRLAEGSDFPTG
ncbi:hypothetical protein BBI11_14335 [Planococcus maritimus]|nr:hypothetical protein BBI11_14335 [Planococcus maritimus]